MTNPHLGQRVREARDARHLTQAELCELVPGLTQQTLSALEARNSKTSLLLFAIADALNVNPRWLLTGHGDSWLTRPYHPLHDHHIDDIFTIYNKLSDEGRLDLHKYAKLLGAQSMRDAPPVYERPQFTPPSIHSPIAPPPTKPRKIL